MSLCAAWKGEIGDDRLFYAMYSGSEWTTPSQNTLPGNSSVGPSLAHSDATGVVYAAWKGEGSDTRDFFSTWTAAGGWTPQAQMPGGSDTGPALASLNGTLYAVWKGQNGDERLWWASYNGSTWAGQQQLLSETSAIGPSLVAYGTKLYAAWRGNDGDETDDGDQQGHYAMFDGTWHDEGTIPGVLSTSGPSLAVYDNTLYAAWRGRYALGNSPDYTPDERLWYSTYTVANGWSGSVPIPGANSYSSTGPALGTLPGGDLYAMWKGTDGDQSLYFASFNGQQWTSLGTVPGNTGEDVAPLPLDGLQSGSNYYLQSAGCNPVTNLEVTFTVTTEMILESGAGMGFQLNCESLPGYKVGWQQYGFDIPTLQTNPDGIEWWVDNYKVSGATLDQVEEPFPNFAPVENPPTLPIGATLSIRLGSDSEGNITSATYTVAGVPNAPPPLTYTLPYTSSSGYVAPVVSCQAVVVSSQNTAHFSQGAGTITYAATSPLTALDSAPSCQASTITGELANTSYGVLASSASTNVVQSFSIQ